MNKAERDRIITPIKASHKSYFAKIVDSTHHEVLKSKFIRLRQSAQRLLRKEAKSSRSFNMIPNLARLMFGLHEDLHRLKLPSYSFEGEKQVVNKYVLEYLRNKIALKYSKGISYGETLLNCYLDIFITLTVLKTSKEIGARPSFLINPATGSNLEIDVLFENFKIGFEFQGELHYQDVHKQARDAFKLGEIPKKGRLLIPINVSQLNSIILQSLIVNSIKDYLELHELLDKREPSAISYGSASNGDLRRFSKVAQRLYLSKVLFQEAIEWLDGESQTYIQSDLRRNPSGISSRHPAPRFKNTGVDFSIEYIYKNLKYVTQVRKRRAST